MHFLRTWVHVHRFVRYTRLVGRFRHQYPELPADYWIPAWDAAMRRAERVWREAGADALVYRRLLPDEHFDFRGGKPRAMTWHPAPERLSDPTHSEMVPE